MTTSRRPVRIGAVRYLNTKPLICGLADSLPDAELRLDLPSRLAAQLAAGSLDVALIPAAAFFHLPGARIISDACIGCRGPVWSVKLFCRVPPQEVRTLALDEGSRTSAMLTRVLLKHRYGLEPELQPLPIGHSLRESDADAVLLIGDRAMNSQPGPFAAVWDLGDIWYRQTELPFVFAMWVARPGWEVDPAVEAAFLQARSRGLAQVSEIAAAEAPALGLTEPECVTYLNHYLHFTLGPRERQGLRLFYQLACEMGLAPEGVDLGTYHCQAAG